MFGYFHFSPYTTSFHLFCYKYYIFLPASLVFNIFFVIILIFVKIITPIPPFFSLLRFPFFYVNNMPLPLLLKKYLRFPEYGFHLFILPALLQPFSGNTFAYRKTAFTSVYLPPALRCISESLQFTGKRFRCLLRCRRICICAPRIYLTLLQNRHFETCCMQQRKNASSAARFFAQNDSGSFLSLSFTDKKARPLSRRTRTKSLNSGSQDDIYESAGY